MLVPVATAIESTANVRSTPAPVFGRIIFSSPVTWSKYLYAYVFLMFSKPSFSARE